MKKKKKPKYWIYIIGALLILFIIVIFQQPKQEEIKEVTEAFRIGEPYSSDSDKITKIDYNHFKIGYINASDNPMIIMPLKFNTIIRDITYNFECEGIEGYNFFAESNTLNKESLDSSIWLDKDGFSFFSFMMGDSTSNTLIFSSKRDSGAYVDYVDNDEVRIAFILNNFYKIDFNLECTFNIVSEEPPFRESTSIFLEYVRDD